ncbi:hypothetical protein FVF72_00565 [Methanothermobacter sp. KEPCO-1]|uniref:pseudomurein-binding repeat-containing protein n=1 Tax=Methanothermobacter sp. KEPCO-1 TaxID=2603820 RepID=UPI0011CCB04E|nr:transglutaminase domain-containing protein [Methanothermobacter sp. KEPCO-1]QEF93781.1 hypothetical protein FVF72_00565 [Methanothermobacter sp. KEPCO-1]
MVLLFLGSNAAVALEISDNGTSSGTEISDNQTLTESENQTLTESENQTSDDEGGRTSAQTEETSEPPHGAIWVKAYDMGRVNLTELREKGITDIFLEQLAFNDARFSRNLTSFLGNASEQGIRVSAWVICLKDSSGKWVDPTGRYAYNVTKTSKVTVKEPYRYYYTVTVKKAYTRYVKKWYKSWYRKNGKWRYTWKYRYVKKTYYKYVKETRYTIKYRTVTKTVTTTETVYGYNTTYSERFLENLTQRILSYTNISGVGGVHLDYIRYPGNAYQAPNATNTITEIVKRISEAVRAVNPGLLLSAALMPEKSSNAHYYGQNYTQLAEYLDVLIPMAYKGNYREDSAWIQNVTSYIKAKSLNAEVWTGLQTYRSDSNVTPIPEDELMGDINAALSGGADGYALFRYGLIDTDFIAGIPSATTKPSAANSITAELIMDAASRFKAFVESNYRLPSYVTVGERQVTPAEFLYLLAELLTGGDLKTGSFSEGSNTTLSASGTIQKDEYLRIASQVISYMSVNGRPPTSVPSSAGSLSFNVLTYILSKIAAFKEVNGRLPNYVTVESSVFSGGYLSSTANCQVSAPEIQSLAASITRGLTSALSKATAIFNWVRDHIDYSFYYNTRYGALGTLKNRTGNCVDMTHLLVALSRAAGIKARYVHATCTFISGNVYGHVWAQFYLNGSWVNADASSSMNSLGVIKNWKSATIKGYYESLPF